MAEDHNVKYLRNGHTAMSTNFKLNRQTQHRVQDIKVKMLGLSVQLES